jgi:putative ABC transport system permease protein
MSLWQIAWSYLWNRKLTTVLTIVSVALAVGLISSVLNLRQQLEQRFAEEGQAFDLVVGPKGSPLELVMSSVYFMDNAIGAMPLEDYYKIKADTEIVTAIFPIGLGDSYEKFRIVGTTPELLKHTWKGTLDGEVRSPFKMAEGRAFAAPMEVVMGAVAANRTGKKIGDSFESTHSMFKVSEDLQEYDHSDHPYTVVGILEPSGTPFDRAIYCSIESVWHAHGQEGDIDGEAADGHDHGAHEDHDHGTETATPAAEGEDHGPLTISAALVQLQGSTQRFEYEGWVNDNTNSMAARPIQVISDFFSTFMDPIKGLLLGIGYLVVIISALSILIGLYLSIIQRKRDLAIMRALGASSYEIFGAIIIEAFWVTVLGIAAGWLFGGLVTYILGQILVREYGLVITPFNTSGEEIRAFASVALVGLVAGILPAWQAYNGDVAHDLADRQ